MNGWSVAGAVTVGLGLILMGFASYLLLLPAPDCEQTPCDSNGLVSPQMMHDILRGVWFWGLGVGAVLVALGAGLFFWGRRREHKQAAAQPPPAMARRS